MFQLGPCEQHALDVEAVTRGCTPRSASPSRARRRNRASSGDRVSDCYLVYVPATALGVDSGKTYGQPVHSKAKRMIRLLRSGRPQALDICCKAVTRKHLYFDNKSKSSGGIGCLIVVVPRSCVGTSLRLAAARRCCPLPLSLNWPAAGRSCAPCRPPERCNDAQAGLGSRPVDLRSSWRGYGLYVGDFPRDTQHGHLPAEREPTRRCLQQVRTSARRRQLVRRGWRPICEQHDREPDAHDRCARDSAGRSHRRTYGAARTLTLQCKTAWHKKEVNSREFMLAGRAPCAGCLRKGGAK